MIVNNISTDMLRYRALRQARSPQSAHRRQALSDRCDALDEPSSPSEAQSTEMSDFFKRWTTASARSFSSSTYKILIFFVSLFIIEIIKEIIEAKLKNAKDF